MKKTLGYGYKLSYESLAEAVEVYEMSVHGKKGWHTTKRDALLEIQIDKEAGRIPKNAKPKVFKVTVETL